MNELINGSAPSNTISKIEKSMEFKGRIFKFFPHCVMETSFPAYVISLYPFAPTCSLIIPGLL